MDCADDRACRRLSSAISASALGVTACVDVLSLTVCGGLAVRPAASARSIKLAEIREMEAILFDNGLALGNRWSGRR